MKYLLPLFCVMILSSCGLSYDYVVIQSRAEYEQERLFLESMFADNTHLADLKIKLIDEKESNRKPKILIDVFSLWEKDAASDSILISRTVLVPKEDPLSWRTNTSFSACTSGSETLVPLEEIAPPFVALRVDGLALGDESYPLVRTVGIQIQPAGNKTPNKRLLAKIQALSEMLTSADKPLVLPKPEPLWITAGGDLMLGRGASEILLKDGGAAVFGKTAAMLNDSDLALVNLEGAVSSRGEKIQKSFNFRFSPETAPALKTAGIDAVLFANNHVYDYGETAFLDSLSLLSKAEIGVLGAGNNDDAASAPFVYKRENESVRIFGIASFPREKNGWDGIGAAATPSKAGMLHSGRGGIEMLKANIQADDRDSLNIVLFHGGEEWSTQPDESTRTMYTELVNAGADLIIGTHPHIVQGFEWVEGKPVFWSLGNYVFAGMENTGGGDNGLFLRLGFVNGKLLYLEPFALTLIQAKTEIADSKNLATFYERSNKLLN
jgi:poly-gamma-glutamate synthesis protein (capsule biosynthesis protein)